jgi:hypothetical protein
MFKWRSWCALSVLLVLLLGSCNDWKVRSTVFIDLNELRIDPDDTHYQIWLDEPGGTFSLGCYAVEQRASSCSYFNRNPETLPDGTVVVHVSLNEQPVVVQCECPCAEKVVNPCIEVLASRGITIEDDGRLFTKGDVVGIVENGLPTLTESGVEIPSTIDFTDATRLYFTRESNTDAAIDEPATTIMTGALHRSAGGLQGLLQTVASERASAFVSIIFASDGESL